MGDSRPGNRIVITDEVAPAGGRTVLLRPPSLVVGVGASRGVSAAEVLSLIDTVLEEAGLSPLSVAALATVDAKADEPGITEAAARRGWPVVSYPAAVLATVDVPNPSAAPLAAVGTPSVAEAAALTRGDVLVAGKHKSAMATAAVAGSGPAGGWPWSGWDRGHGICSRPGLWPSCAGRPYWPAWTSTWTRSGTCCGQAPGCCPPASAQRRSGPGRP